ncbi:MAG TPA: GNAT family N-acetyltransferase [Pirellulales bacterium]|nr:GNAT family N-acetyltransferase [Pirellulales bacterium]
MKAEACNDVILGPAPPECLRAALDLVLRPLPPDDRPRVIDQTLRAAADGRRSLDGLFAARRGRRVVGAVWAETQPGRTAGVWPPQVADAQALALESALLEHAANYLRDRHVVMAQALVATDARTAADAFRAAGFEHLTDLLYLVSTSGQFPTSPPAHELIFEPVGSDSEARLATVVEATYKETLDCPRLNGVRDCGDILAGYRDTSHDDTSHWFLVRSGDRDIGCLLLACHAEIETWEVVYMGLAADARGKGLGVELARHAQWLVRAAGGDRLMLAVDAANEPAIKTYAAAGFVTFDRRRVFVRFFDG